jgi:hypothetical protein
MLDGYHRLQPIPLPTNYFEVFRAKISDLLLHRDYMLWQILSSLRLINVGK